MQINPLKQLYIDLMKIVTSAEVKYKVLADNNETVETKKSADAYIKASRGEDVFETYYRYDEDLIAEICNITDTNLIESYHYDRSLIPYGYRDLLLRRTRKKIIDEYEERNNYYRCLQGLPNIEEDEINFFYVPDEYLDILGLEETVPIHTLIDSQISILSSHGLIDTLIEKNPTKKYLKYLGTKKIDLISARTAKNFSLISIPYNISESLWNTFSMMYEQCREYFTTCVYITEYRQIFDFYDNFIALCIMVMAMQQVISRTLKSTIDREFFDEYSVKLLFDVYGVPYNASMASDTRKQIVQSLNTLVLNKGTNKVLFDIASILGYDRIQIYKYYIMRTQKFNENGIPIEKYKKDETTGKDVLDYKNMYDVYFQKVLIDDNDAYKAIMDKKNYVPYQEIIESDPYWIDDSELQKELYESEYNYVESKYMGVSIIYRMTKILFENVYLLRMIFDKKDEIPYITIDIPKISAFEPVPLFDAIVYLCAMTCKQNKLKGEILTQPSKILHVMGFDFNNDFDAIREEILSDPNIDDSLADLIKDTSCITADKLNNVYRNLLSFYDILVEKMSTTQSIEAYQSYKKLYDTIFYTKENQSMFNIGTVDNPVYASTFMEYIQHTNPDIYNFIETMDTEQIHVYTNHIANKVLSIIPNLKYLGFFADSSSTLEAMLVELIRFFKSYTTDMIGLDMILILDMKPETLLRFIEKVFIHNKIQLNDELMLSYSDSLNFTSTVRYSSDLKFRDVVSSITTWMSMWDTIYFLDKINIYSHLQIDSDLNYMDIIREIYDTLYLKSDMLYLDMLRIYSEYRLKTDMKFEDLVMLIITESIESRIELSDMIHLHSKIFLTDNNIDFDENISLQGFYQMRSDLLWNDIIRLLIESKMNESFSLFDTLTTYESLNVNDILNITDKMKDIAVRILYNDNLIFEDRIYMLSSLIACKTELSMRESWLLIIHIVESDAIRFKDIYDLTSYIYIKERILMLEAIEMSCDMMMNSNLNIDETIYTMSTEDLKEELGFIDKQKINHNLYLGENSILLDRLTNLINEIRVKDALLLKDLVSITSRLKERDSFILRNRYAVKCIILFKEILLGNDNIFITKTDIVNEKARFFDIADMYTSETKKDKFAFSDRCKITFI